MKEVVIKMSDEMYDWFLTGFPDKVDIDELQRLVIKGAVLSKGHGRLIDADKYKHLWIDIYDSSYGDKCAKMFKESIDKADTILEADGNVK